MPCKYCPRLCRLHAKRKAKLQLCLPRPASPHRADVERASRLAVERLASPAGKAQQATFLLQQVIRGQQQQHAGAAAAGGSTAGPSAAPPAAATAVAAGGGADAMDALVVSAIAQLPATFVAGCAARMFMSAARALLALKPSERGWAWRGCCPRCIQPPRMCLWYHHACSKGGVTCSHTLREPGALPLSANPRLPPSLHA